MSAGFRHACALTARGRVYCWGQDKYGQLSNGELEGGVVEVPLGEGAVHIAADFGRTCAITVSNEVFCWGRDPALECPPFEAQYDDIEVLEPCRRPTPMSWGHIDDAVSLSIDKERVCAVTAHHDLVCLGPAFGLSGPAAHVRPYEPRTYMTGVIAADLDGRDACVLLGGGEVRCWGSFLGRDAGRATVPPGVVAFRAPDSL